MRRNLTLLLTGIALFGAGMFFGSNDSTRFIMAADAQSADRVYEIRTYTAHDGKLDDLHRRFRDHTTRLFERHGMTNVAYWVPQDERAKNTLVYVLAYPSREAAERSWTEFRADPEWQAARAASEEAGPIVQRVESVFLDPTDYSPMK